MDKHTLSVLVENSPAFERESPACSHAGVSISTALRWAVRIETTSPA